MRASYLALSRVASRRQALALAEPVAVFRVENKRRPAAAAAAAPARKAPATVDVDWEEF
jgi:hypothetical protein